MKGYIVVVYEEINDEEAMKNYAEKATLAIKKYSPKVLVRGGKSINLEGKASPRTVVIEFPNIEDAKNFYHSSEYQEAIKTIIGIDYPAPLVKHEVARQEALNAFQSLKKN